MYSVLARMQKNGGGRIQARIYICRTFCRFMRVLALAIILCDHAHFFYSLLSSAIAPSSLFKSEDKRVVVSSSSLALELEVAVAPLTKSLRHLWQRRDSTRPGSMLGLYIG